MTSAAIVAPNVGGVVPGLAHRLGYVPLVPGRAVVVPGAAGVVIEERAMATFLRWRQGAHEMEACGLIVGREVVGERGVIIDAASEPGPADVREPRFCQRLDPSHQRFVLDAWDGVTHYLGNWHTHAEPVPNPSPFDLDGWRDDLADMEEQGLAELRLLYVIVGQTHVGVWEIA